MARLPAEDRRLNGLVLGTAGHIDHGKSALIRCKPSLASITDRLARGEGSRHHDRSGLRAARSRLTATPSRCSRRARARSARAHHGGRRDRNRPCPARGGRRRRRDASDAGARGDLRSARNLARPRRAQQVRRSARRRSGARGGGSGRPLEGHDAGRCRDPRGVCDRRHGPGRAAERAGCARRRGFGAHASQRPAEARRGPRVRDARVRSGGDRNALRQCALRGRHRGDPPGRSARAGARAPELRADRGPDRAGRPERRQPPGHPALGICIAAWC